MTASMFTRRTEAVKTLHATIAPASNGYQITADNETIARMIRELAPLSRASRWTVAVEGWARFVEAYPSSTAWAYLQGSVMFGHSTDGLIGL